MRDRFELRAREFVAQCLVRLLIVPRIYFEADWPGLAHGRIDVLAIDRDGVGDAHLVEIRRTASDALRAIPRLLAARAPYRWIAYFHATEDAAAQAALASREVLYPEQGAGRIGVIEIVQMSGDDLGANVRIKAERFPTPTYDLAVQYAGTHEAQMKFGE